MTHTSRIARTITLCAGLALTVAGQVLAAPTIGKALDAPSRIDHCVNSAIKAGAPQWVLDRQQYETTYVYDAAQRDSGQAAAVEAGEPGWVTDRQQYETAYIYDGSVGDAATSDTVCAPDSETGS